MTEPRVDTTRPSSARVWNYLLGGKDNFAIDRMVGDQIKEIFPAIVVVAREQRKFLVRAVTFLTEDAGIRQFLDIGTGLPTANNTHQVVQRIAPESRIVYVDNDPMVLVHARPAHRRPGRVHRLHRLRCGGPGQEIVGYFDGLELAEPGVVSTPQWRPGPGPLPAAVDGYCGVARKP